MRCVLFEENEELSVKVFRAIDGNQCLDCANDSFVLYDGERKERVVVRLRRQEISLNGSTRIRLFSETYFKNRTKSEKSAIVYYTLQISDHDGSFALFRAFSANKTVADRLFEQFFSLDVSCINAIDLYRENRMRVLRELWFCGM